MNNEKESELDLISVIVPVYNLENNLHYCIRSVLNQTYTNIQIIMVDDGSTDSSGKICDEYTEKYSRVKCIHQNNVGVSAARNRGIAEASGRFIMFLDGDDIIAPHAVEILIKDFHDEENCIFSGFSYSRISDYEYEFPIVKSDYLKMDSEEIIKGLLNGKYENIGVCGKMFPRAKIGDLRFVEGKYFNEDKFFLFQYLLNNDGKITERKEQLYGYYTRVGSATTSSFTYRNLDVIYFSERILEIIKSEKKELILDAEYNDLVAHLMVTKAIMRSNCYGKEKKIFKKIKNELRARYGGREKAFYRRYWFETKVLLVSDYLYKVCVFTRDLLMRK